MRRVHRNEAAVDAEAQTLFRPDHLQIRIGVQRERDERGEGIGDGNIAGNQIVMQVLVFQNMDVGAKRIELFGGFREYRVIRGVHALVHGEEHHAEGDARVVDQTQAVLKGRIPEVVEALDVDIHNGRIVDNQRDTADIGNDILIVRIKELMGEALVQVGIVIDDGRVERLHQTRFTRGVEHIVARQNDVVVAAAHRGELLVHLFVAGEGRVVDLDARFLLKGLDDGFVVDVAFPSEDVENGFVRRVRRFRQRTRAQRKHRQQYTENLLHSPVPPYQGIVNIFKRGNAFEA